MPTSDRPAGFPTDIPVSQETFENWAQMIDVPGVWTCVPQTEDDVVRVCNWAAGANFSVRPRGIMHTWSPLTVVDGQSAANVMLVDMTQKLTSITVTPAVKNAPSQVRVQTGATMDMLLAALENAAGGGGAAAGFAFAHTPAPGNITVGGALAINAHGTAVPTPPNDDFDIPYGSLSNQILAFTAVVSMPGSKTYAARTFTRGDADARAFLTHCGRALLLNVTLQVTDNYNLRCQSFMDIPSTTLFAQPSGSTPPAGSVGAYLNQSGRVEVIWFPSFPVFGFPPPTSYPWLKVWTVAKDKPAASTAVTAPYNYPFSDNLPSSVTGLIKQILGGAAWLTPIFSATFEAITSAGLKGDLGGSNVTDLWGPSKNTLLYIKDTTLRVTANGYAVLMKKAQVQQAVADFATKFSAMLAAYQARKLWPINSPLEIRVTALDDPSKIAVRSAASPVISSLSLDPVVVQNGWDVACWFDVLTVIPAGDPQKAYEFYTELEAWFTSHFASGFRVAPEWSKGWAYTAAGAWTNPTVLQSIRDMFTTGRSADDTWAWQVQTLAGYDAANLFSNPFLDQLFTA
ncbi:MAG TPA: cholesterol oxidase substrate-binding domain-containing protein [Vicinamibacterales bacterium]|nr:cholesterol oxidase substrate-binding domain-containing protein [Vicinamibacterales bacterium]